MPLLQNLNKFLFPPLDPALSQGFNREILKVNLTRGKYLSLLLSVLNLVGIGIDIYLYTQGNVQYEVFYFHLMLSLCFGVYFFISRNGLRKLGEGKLKNLGFIPFSGALFSLFFAMCIALLNYKAGDAPVLYFVSICAGLIAFYWSVPEALFYYFAGNLLFITGIIWIGPDTSQAVVHIGNSFIFSTVFIALSRMFYQLKFREFKNFTEVKEQSALLKEKNFELDQFVYKTSHDLRAPLTSILGLTQLIELETELDPVKKQVNMIRERALKLDEFIKSLLNYSRSNNSEVVNAPVSFAGLISQSLEELQYVKNFDRVKINTDIRGEEVFYGDELRLSIIFKNLLSNAIKYQNEQHKERLMNIRIEVTRNEAVIRVSDNGIGIRDEYLGQIFNMFYRAHEQSEGSGLGLYIVKQTVEKLKGKINVSSKFGVGTAFFINIPNQPPK